jgi:hypothetical protein
VWSSIPQESSATRHILSLRKSVHAGTLSSSVFVFVCLVFFFAHSSPPCWCSLSSLFSLSLSLLLLSSSSSPEEKSASSERPSFHVQQRRQLLRGRCYAAAHRHDIGESRKQLALLKGRSACLCLSAFSRVHFWCVALCCCCAVVSRFCVFANTTVGGNHAECRRCRHR